MNSKGVISAVVTTTSRNSETSPRRFVTFMLSKHVPLTNLLCERIGFQDPVPDLALSVVRDEQLRIGTMALGFCKNKNCKST